MMPDRVSITKLLPGGPEHHIMLNSGGMDSLLVHHSVRNHRGNKGDTFVSVFMTYDQEYATKELHAAHRIARAYGLETITARCAPIAVYEHPSGIVPFRNAELLLTAAQEGTAVGTNVLYMGVLANEVNSDKSRAFLWYMKGVLNVSHKAQYWTKGKRYTIRTPLRRKTKSQAVAEYLATGGDVDLLLSTVSCYSGSEEPCGRCASCFKRWVALTNNGLTQDFRKDPVDMYDPTKLKGYNRARRREIQDAMMAAYRPNR